MSGEVNCSYLCSAEREKSAVNINISKPQNNLIMKAMKTMTSKVLMSIAVAAKSLFTFRPVVVQYIGDTNGKAAEDKNVYQFPIHLFAVYGPSFTCWCASANVLRVM